MTNEESCKQQVDWKDANKDKKYTTQIGKKRANCDPKTEKAELPSCTCGDSETGKSQWRVDRSRCTCTATAPVFIWWRLENSARRMGGAEEITGWSKRFGGGGSITIKTFNGVMVGWRRDGNMPVYDKCVPADKFNADCNPTDEFKADQAWCMTLQDRCKQQSDSVVRRCFCATVVQQMGNGIWKKK